MNKDEKLESIEAANYLIQELLAQIEALKEENNQVVLILRSVVNKR